MNTFKKTAIITATAFALLGLVGCTSVDNTAPVVEPSPSVTTDPDVDGYVLPEDDSLAVPDDIPGVSPNSTVSLNPVTSEEAQAYCFNADAVHFSEATSLLVADDARVVYRCYTDETGDRIFKISEPTVIAELLSVYASTNAEAAADQVCTEDIADPQILWVNSPTVDSTEVIYAPVNGCGKPSAAATEALTKALASATEL